MTILPSGGREMDNVSSLTLNGLTRFDALGLRELQDELDEPADSDLVEISDGVVDETKHGEFLSAVVVVWLSVQGVRLLASWLNKHRVKEELTLTGTITDPDGSTRTTTIVWKRTESEAANEKQLEALAKLLHVELPKLPS
jgi:hypothetical protein